jgi:hypothetical protein
LRRCPISLFDQSVGECYGIGYCFAIQAAQAARGELDGFSAGATEAPAGNWAGETETSISHENAHRNCCATDPDDGGSLLCDSWTWAYSDGGDRHSIGDALSPRSLTINVGAVPEPDTIGAVGDRHRVAGRAPAPAPLKAIRRRQARGRAARCSGDVTPIDT